MGLVSLVKFGLGPTEFAHVLPGPLSLGLLLDADLRGHCRATQGEGKETFADSMARTFFVDLGRSRL